MKVNNGNFCVGTAIITSKNIQHWNKIMEEKYHAFVSKKICMFSKSK